MGLMDETFTETELLAASGARGGTTEIGAAPALEAGLLDRLLAADERLLVAARRWHGPWRTRLARGLTRAGDASSWTLLVLALLATPAPSVVRIGLRLGAATLLATAASQWVKRRLSRPRPTSAIQGFAALAENPDAFSFPSGHTAAAFAAAVALAGAGLLGPAAATLAVGIGLSRVYLGAHYPLDVAVGAMLGTMAGAAAQLLVA
jgi:undecaprenyl-diphosphatase